MVGIGGASGYLILLTGLVELLNVEPVLASVFSYIPVIIVSYYLSFTWVFRAECDHRLAFVRYLVVTGIGFALNTTGMYLTIHLLGWWYLYGQGATFGAVAVSNYLLNHYWTFSRVETI